MIKKLLKELTPDDIISAICLSLLLIMINILPQLIF